MSAIAKQSRNANISKSLINKPKSQQHKKAISKSLIDSGVRQGEKNPNYNKIYVFNGDDEQHIYQCQLQDFINMGY